MKMRSAILAAAAGAGLALLSASDAGAASFALELNGGYTDLTGINRTADALFGSRGGFSAGAAVRLDLGSRWFVRAGATRLSKSGQRVFVADSEGPVFPLGHPLDFKLTP